MFSVSIICIFGGDCCGVLSGTSLTYSASFFMLWASGESISGNSGDSGSSCCLSYWPSRRLVRPLETRAPSEPLGAKLILGILSNF